MGPCTGQGYLYPRENTEELPNLIGIDFKTKDGKNHQIQVSMTNIELEMLIKELSSATQSSESRECQK